MSRKAQSKARYTPASRASIATLPAVEPLLATPGEKSRRVTWEDVRATAPDVVIVAPCGFDREGSARLADELVASGVLPPGVPVHAVDANASWARPGTRLPDGIEELGQLLRTVKVGVEP